MEDTKTAWERKAAAWIQSMANPNNQYAMLVGFVAELVNRHIQGGKTLDIGCGPAILSQRLAEMGFEVYGTDVSERMIEAARARLSGTIESPESRFRVCAEGEIPFQGMQFDLITAIHVFSYIPNYRQYIRTLRSLVAPGRGLVAASNTNRLSLHVMLSVLEFFFANPPRRECIRNLLRTGYASGGYVDYDTAEQAYSAAAFDAMFVGEGFSVVDCLDWFNRGRFGLDQDPLNRGTIGKIVARRLAWIHVGVYRPTDA